MCSQLAPSCFFGPRWTPGTWCWQTKMSSQSRNVTFGSVCSIPTDTLSQMKAGITWGKWVFVCLTLRGIYKFNVIFDLYQSLTKAPQTRKIPGKVLELFPDQRGRTLCWAEGTLQCWILSEMWYFQYLRANSRHKRRQLGLSATSLLAADQSR